MQKLLSIKEAADSLGITHTALNQAIRRGSIKAIPIGNRNALTPEAVEEYRQRTQPDGIKSKGRPKKGTSE